jgi:hypothetical protein
MRKIFQTSEQTRLIRNMMAARKRALSMHHVTYPKWAPGMTTREYVARFKFADAFALVDPAHVPNRPAPYLTNDLVIVEEVRESEARPELLAAY